MKLAIVGATGNVGRKLIEVLEKKKNTFKWNLFSCFFKKFGKKNKFFWQRIHS